MSCYAKKQEEKTFQVQGDEKNEREKNRDWLGVCSGEKIYA